MSDDQGEEVFVFTGDITDYWSYTQIRDYLLVMPELPHTALRLYELLRSMISEARKNRPGAGLRRMSIDQLCWLLPGVNGKPVSVSTMYELLGCLERLNLVVPKDMQEVEGASQMKGEEKAARGILRGYKVKDLPPAAYTGWRNAWDKLDAYRPDWRESMPQPPTHLTTFGALDDEGHEVAQVQRLDVPAESFQKTGTGESEGSEGAGVDDSEEGDPFQKTGTAFQDSGTAFQESGTDSPVTCGNAAPKEASLRSSSNVAPSARSAPDVRRTGRGSRHSAQGGSAASGKNTKPRTRKERDAIDAVRSLLPAVFNKALPVQTPPVLADAILAGLAVGSPSQRTPAQLVEFRVMKRWDSHWGQEFGAGRIESPVGALVAMLDPKSASKHCGSDRCDEGVDVDFGTGCRSCGMRKVDWSADRQREVQQEEPAAAQTAGPTPAAPDGLRPDQRKPAPWLEEIPAPAIPREQSPRPTIVMNTSEGLHPECDDCGHPLRKGQSEGLCDRCYEPAAV